jgi:outer membrane protein assembly factor BamD (BamD/ComL family)
MKKESKKDIEMKIAGQLYATAYGTHHMGKDPAKALKLYKEFIAAYPNAKEVGYAQSQIKAIESGYSRQNPIRVQTEEIPANSGAPVSSTKRRPHK